MRVRQTDLRQTGVAIVETISGEESMIPLFSNNLLAEAYNSLLNVVKDVKEIIPFGIRETNNMEEIRTGVKGRTCIAKELFL